MKISPYVPSYFLRHISKRGHVFVQTQSTTKTGSHRLKAFVQYNAQAHITSISQVGKMYYTPATTNHTCIDEFLVSHLIAEQFPEFVHLSIEKVQPGGWDNRSFRLGEGEYIVRLPSKAEYAPQVDKEHKWLAYLAPQLPLSIPKPIGCGEPTEEYPWRWSIYQWIAGDTAANTQEVDMQILALELAEFLRRLHLIDSAGGPTPGDHNFQRGGNLSYYDSETMAAIEALNTQMNTSKILDLWRNAKATTWNHAPVWVHGDISAGNLLIDKGELSAVIDFGMLSVGDPACDLSIAWTYFDQESREIFKSHLGLDEATWERALGWALWKALIVTAGFSDTTEVEKNNAANVIRAIVTET